MSHYIADEHRDWHTENGPSGPYGVSCPWDACGYAFADDAEAAALAAEEAEQDGRHAPALRPGEEPAPLVRYGMRPDGMDAPDVFGAPWTTSDPWTIGAVADPTADYVPF